MQTIPPPDRLDWVYCAGPLFNQAERREMEDISRALGSKGFRTYLPHADGMEFAKVQPVFLQWGHDPATAGQLLHEVIFALDVYHVVLGCGSLVFNMNGRVPDEGAVAELTMAWTLGKPVVIYKEDARSMIAGRDNPLVVGQTGFEVVAEIDQLAPALKARIAEVDPPANDVNSCPPHLQRTLELGGELWRRLEQLGTQRHSEEVARIVLDLFADHPAPPR